MSRTGFFSCNLLFYISHNGFDRLLHQGDVEAVANILTHQLVGVWISASSGSLRFFICTSMSCYRLSTSMALRAASASSLAKV